MLQINLSHFKSYLLVPPFNSSNVLSDLSRNNITALAKDNFIGQEHLDELDVSHNKINGLTSWVFEHLKVNWDNLFICIGVSNKLFEKKLCSIDSTRHSTNISKEISNKIETKHKIYCVKHSATWQHGKLSTRSHRYWFILLFLQELRRLNLADNLIEKLAHRVFYKVSKLKYLDLSENPLTDLTPDVFRDITVRTEKSIENARLFYSISYSRCNHIIRVQSCFVE